MGWFKKILFELQDMGLVPLDDEGEPDYQQITDEIMMLAPSMKKMVARRYWNQLRRWVTTGAIAWYWLEQTQIHLCAPGGEGRKRDREAFERS